MKVRKITARILAVVMVLTLLPFAGTPRALGTTQFGVAGEVAWLLNTDTGVLRFTGSGSMLNWDAPSEVPWRFWWSAITSVEIDQGVTSIGSNAFARAENLETVRISDSVTAIGNSVFTECFSLKSITVSGNNPVYSDIDGVLFNKDGTTLIKYPAHAADTYIIPDGVTLIDNGAFANCKTLKSIVIPDSVEIIGINAFLNCVALEAVRIPEGVTTIGATAFSGCTSLKSILIPGSVVFIGSEDAFANCHPDLVICCHAGSYTHNFVSFAGISFCLETYCFFCPGCGSGKCDNYPLCIYVDGKTGCNGECNLTQVRRGNCIFSMQTDNVLVPSVLIVAGSSTATPHPARINLTQERIDLAGFVPDQIRIVRNGKGKFKNIKEGQLTWNFSRLINKKAVIELANSNGNILRFAEIADRPKPQQKPYVNYTIYEGVGTASKVSAWGWTLAERGTVKAYSSEIKIDLAVAPYGTPSSPYTGDGLKDKPLKKTEIALWGGYDRICVPDISQGAKFLVARTQYLWKTGARQSGEGMDATYTPSSKPKRVSATTFNKPVKRISKGPAHKFRAGTYMDGERRASNGLRLKMDPLSLEATWLDTGTSVTGTWVWYLNPKGNKAPTSPVQLTHSPKKQRSGGGRDREFRCMRACCTGICEECERNVGRANIGKSGMCKACEDDNYDDDYDYDECECPQCEYHN